MKKKAFAWVTAFCMLFSFAVCAAPVRASADFPSWFEEEESWSIEVPVLLVNGTGEKIFSLYLCSSSDGDWGEDRLGAEILYPGEYLKTVLTIRDPEFLWDLKTVEVSGTERFWYDVYIGRMPSDIFIIELLSDGSSGYLNLATDLDELVGYYGPMV